MKFKKMQKKNSFEMTKKIYVFLYFNDQKI